MAQRMKRLQVKVNAEERLLLDRFKSALDGDTDSETARKLLWWLDGVAHQVGTGYKLVVVPIETEFADAAPWLTRAMLPSGEYTYLVRRPHPWRKQLFLKGRRLTAGQVVGRMETEGWSVEEAAAQFELPVAAIREAVDYAKRNRDLIACEDAEDARAADELPHVAPTS